MKEGRSAIFSITGNDDCHIILRGGTVPNYDAANIQLAADQVSKGDKRIIGVMIESHLVEGRQDVVPGKELTYGQSITDACILWESTEFLLRELAAAVRVRREV